MCKTFLVVSLEQSDFDTKKKKRLAYKDKFNLYGNVLENEGSCWSV